MNACVFFQDARHSGQDTLKKIRRLAVSGGSSHSARHHSPGTSFGGVCAGCDSLIPDRCYVFCFGGFFPLRNVHRNLEIWSHCLFCIGSRILLWKKASRRLYRKSFWETTRTSGSFGIRFLFWTGLLCPRSSFAFLGSRGASFGLFRPSFPSR